MPLPGAGAPSVIHNDMLSENHVTILTCGLGIIFNTNLICW